MLDPNYTKAEQLHYASKTLKLLPYACPHDERYGEELARHYSGVFGTDWSVKNFVWYAAYWIKARRGENCGK